MSTRARQARLPPRSLWIIDPLRDLLLIVGPPLVILPALWAAGTRFRPEQIYLFVASFGAVGHHLPGMMRAYGDRFLFDRFKARFLITPLLLGGACVLFAVRDLTALVLVAYVWGVWHGLMQTYGFLRIYDGKAGSVSSITARLDMAMCVTWFGAAVLLSPTRMTKLATDYYNAGGAVVPPVTLAVAADLWVLATAIVTVAFLARLVYGWLRGEHQSPAKLALLVVSIAFWWYSNVAVSNMLVGIALFEVFHDVQYLTIVWIFNVNRVDRNPGVGSFAGFLFRRSWSLAGLYVGLVAAYGALNYLPTTVSDQTISRMLTGLLTASALLHFYYDGFIWKVREPAVSESLGLRPDARRRSFDKLKAGPIEPTTTGWAHGLKWAALAVPVLWLGVSQARGAVDRFERDRLVAEAVPQSAQARNNLGGSLLLQGRVDEAIPQLQEALRLQPEHAEAHSNLGVALARRGRTAEAIDHYRESLRLDPRQTQAYSNLGNALLAQGNITEAIAQFEAALALDPADPQARTNLAGAFVREGRVDDAIAEYERVLRTAPGFQPAGRNLEILRGQKVPAAQSGSRVIE
jgi:tetratricopeptide (TPR) repeat protein